MISRKTILRLTDINANVAMPSTPAAKKKKEKKKKQVEVSHFMETHTHTIFITVITQ